MLPRATQLRLLPVYFWNGARGGGTCDLVKTMADIQMHAPSEEPYVEELSGADTLEYPPPDEVPLEHEAAIPARVIDKLFNESDEEAMLGIREVRKSALVMILCCMSRWEWGTWNFDICYHEVTFTRVDRKNT